MSLIVRCPVCKSNSEMEESCLNSPTIECPSCKQVSYMEDFSVMTFCPHCHQKLAIPAEMINEEEILCVTCDQPFKPNSSFNSLFTVVRESSLLDICPPTAISQ